MFTLLYSLGNFEEMAESQIKSKGQKIAAGCRHFTAEWDSHHYCWACRDKKKGDDVCVTSKEEDCYICLQFSSDQKKKLKAKKAYQLKMAKDISKDLEDSLLGSDDPPSATPASSATTSASIEKSTTVDPLQMILQKLDSMQGRLVALEKGSTSVSSNEVNVTEVTPVTEEATRKKKTSLNTFAVMEEEEFPEDFSEHRSAKRARSLSPHQSDKQSSVREEEVEDDPSYRQLLASVRNILDLPTPEEFAEAPSKIFGSKDRKKKHSVLPMVSSPVEEINNRWSELEKKVAGNPSDNGERLLSAPYNSDTFLPYTRPLMKFYRTTSSDFSTSVPKCQDSFRSICSKSSSSPPMISVPTKQFTTMESVKREHVQVLGFVSLFIRTIEKCATNMEELMQAALGSADDAMVKALEELLAYIRIQLATITSTERALETVAEASMTMACNMELAHRDSILKYSAPHLHEHDRNRLRRSGFKSVDLFSPSVLNSVENKYERERSPKRQKLDNRSAYSSRKSSSFQQNSSQNIARGSFRGQTDFKNQQRSSQPTRGGRDGRRK